MIPSNNRGTLPSVTAASAAVIFFFLTLIVCSAFLMLSGCLSRPEPKPPVMIVAHRGGAGLAPENTPAAFTTGLEQGADALEMDVHLSRDGVLMVIHDSLLKTTTGKPGTVSEYDAAAMALFDASVNYRGPSSFPPQPIPTLEEVITLVQNYSRPVLLQIEIKLKENGTRYKGIEEELVRILQKHELIESAVIISFDFPSLERIHELEPDLKRGALISKAYMSGIGTGGPKAVAREMALSGVDYVGINYQYLSQTLYNELRSKKLGIGIWSVNDPQVMLRFSEMGVDFITTDRPDILRDVLNSIK